MDENEVVLDGAAILNFSRVQGRTKLFGTDIVPEAYIELTITPARAERDLARTWYYKTRQPLIRVKMSASQYAQAITSLNINEGTPCTIQDFNGAKVQFSAHSDERVKMDSEVDCEVASVLSELEELVKAISDEKMSQKVKERLTAIARGIVESVSSKLPFIAEAYKEYFDSKEQQAKTEVASYLDLALQDAGLQHLRGQQLLSLQATDVEEVE